MHITKCLHVFVETEMAWFLFKGVSKQLYKNVRVITFIQTLAHFGISPKDTELFKHTCLKMITFTNIYIVKVQDMPIEII